MFYTTVGVHSLLTKGATADHPSRVINIASMAGIQTTDVTTGSEGGLAAPGSGTFSYGPSKAACIHLSKMQASKLMPQNVTVNCICPGVFPSRMTAFGMREAMDTLVAGQPSGRVGYDTNECDPCCRTCADTFALRFTGSRKTSRAWSCSFRAWALRI